MKKMVYLFWLLLLASFVSAACSEEEIAQVNITAIVNTTTIPEKCHIDIDIFSQKTIYNNSEKVKFENRLSDNPYAYKIEYTIEDLAGNVIRKPVITKNTNEKSFTPSIKEREKVYHLLSMFEKIPVDNPLVQTAGEIRRIYGLDIPDALIAASALATDSILITRNIKDFGKVKELKVHKPY